MKPVFSALRLLGLYVLHPFEMGISSSCALCLLCCPTCSTGWPPLTHARTHSPTDQQVEPHLLNPTEILDQSTAQQQQQEPHRIGLMDAGNLGISCSELLGVLSGMLHCHLEGPVSKVGGDTRVDTSEALARNMMAQVMHAGRYAHCNPVTERLNQADHVIQDHLAEQCPGRSPAHAAAAVVAAAQQMVGEEELEKCKKQAGEAASWPDAATSTHAAASSRVRQQAGGELQRASSRQSKGRSKQGAVADAAVQGEMGISNQQEQQRQQPQQTEDVILPQSCAVHHLNMFILTVMFSKAVNAHYWCRGQVLSYILLLIGCNGTRTAGHIDPAAALTFAWPWLQPDEVWSNELTNAPLATWLFLRPCEQAWQRFLEWLTTRQQQAQEATGKRQQQQQVGTVRVPDAVVRSALEGVDLQPEEIAQVVGYVGEEHTVVLQQCAGQAVCVEPGWKHWVFNR